MKIQHSEDYRALRRRSYPSVGDQLDAIMKMAEALRDQGIDLPPETCDWIDRCRAVKHTFKSTAAE